MRYKISAPHFLPNLAFNQNLIVLQTNSRLQAMLLNADYEDIMSLDSLSDWKVDAEKDQNIEHFVPFKMLDRLEDGRRAIVVGRKGTGKSIISRWLSKKYAARVLRIDANIFEKLNAISSTSINKRKDLIEIWKYIVLINVYDQLNSLGILNSDDRKEYLDYKLGAGKIFLKTNKSSHVESDSISGSFWGLNLKRDLKKSLIEPANDISQMLLNLTNNINNYIGDTERHFYVIFDGGMEEDMDATATNIDSYREIVVALIRAIEELKIDSKYRWVRPIICVRDDVFYSLRSNDKSKWLDYIYTPEWNDQKIRDVLKRKMQIAIPSTDENFSILWSHFFSSGNIAVGKNKLQLYDFISSYSQNRPRDYIAFIKIAADHAIERNQDIITPSILKDATSKYSQYVKTEAYAEMGMNHKNFDGIFEALRIIRKPIFNETEFTNKYKTINGGNIDDVTRVLNDLYAYSIIGNQNPSGVTKFTHELDGGRLDFERPIVIHRSLLKSLGMY